MATRKQRAANRRNAQLSTGPKTAEGKAAVRVNALKHGICAENAVIFDEHEEAFNELLNTFFDQLQPAGALESALLDQIVMAQWRLARCRKLETGFFELSFDDHRPDLEADDTDLNANEKLADLFRRNTETIATLSRYEARTERAFYRALHELQRLQAARQLPDPPPPAKTNFAEQTQSAPETQPNPLPPNDLPPVCGAGWHLARRLPTAARGRLTIGLLPDKRAETPGTGSSACPELLPRPPAASVVL